MKRWKDNTDDRKRQEEKTRTTLKTTHKHGKTSIRHDKSVCIAHIAGI